MPEQPEKQYKPAVRHRRSAAGCSYPYAELQVRSNFTFLCGASHPEELIDQAAAFQYRAIAITDDASLAGIVRAHQAARAADMPLIVGSRLDISAAAGDILFSILVYPINRAAYGRLCRLLTIGRGHGRCLKGEYRIYLQDLASHHQDMLAVYLPSDKTSGTHQQYLGILKDLFNYNRLSIAAVHYQQANDAQRLADLAALARRTAMPLVACNDVHYHSPERQPLQDVLSCIRESCAIDQLGLRRLRAGRSLMPPEEIHRLYRYYPQAITRSIEIADIAGQFSLDQLTYQYPHEICPANTTLMNYLMELTWQGAARRYPMGVPQPIKDRITHEFNLIRELNYPAYFLTVYDIVCFAQQRHILCQGRGAAANSAVCYCLGITAVDPTRVDLLMERFISKERNEPPDIDIDFEHERREEVIQYIYRRFGRDRAALTAEVITYRPRSALRDVGKALGLSLACVSRLAQSVDWWDKKVVSTQRLKSLGLDPNNRAMTLTLQLAAELIGFPRHLSQHVGGFVITEGALCDLVPIENAAMADRTIIQWDKDDLDALGILKIDILALGMLTCIRKAIALANAWRDQSNDCRPPLHFYAIESESSAVYDMLCRADSIGIFQVESRAQMAMLPRMKPRNYYDLVVEVALVRPGPIQGGMVHPYLRRRSGEEPVDYPSEAVENVLKRTLGVPLFQEQVMRLAMVAAGFTPGQADELRRSMAAWKRKGNQLQQFEAKLINGMKANGYSEAFAQRCFEQIKGFGEYGFPESHAASFALLVYVSAWLKCFEPAAFAAALINSQPMGFYQPAQIIRDAQAHGVQVRPIDVNYSQWDCTLEYAATTVTAAGSVNAPALRLGLRLISGFSESAAHNVMKAVQQAGSFQSIAALWRRACIRTTDLHKLALADAFRSMGLNRQRALWMIAALSDKPLPLFDTALIEPPATSQTSTMGNATAPVADDAAPLPPIHPARQVLADYEHTGLSLKAHPMQFVRAQLSARHVQPAAAFADEQHWPHGKAMAVAGLVLVRQRPQTAAGILFVTIEDETGVANLIVRPKIYDRFRAVLRNSGGIVAWGEVERQGQVTHLMVQHAADLARYVQSKNIISPPSRDFH
ncbi:MAG: error-prone DNA polymerase [Phycisphaerales bacterium]|nr:error-prone DNA polymerase [Phycisphaerales bacterium]